MAARVCAIDAGSRAGEALMPMPCVGFQPIALRWPSATPLAALIRQAQGMQQLIRASARLAPLQLRLDAGGASPAQVGRVLSSLNDAITCRLIEFAQSELGPAPVAFAWLACGSQGRHEQTVRSDQDNALIFDDRYDEGVHGDYFAQLAQRVNDGLDACGCCYCPGRVMARNPAWRQSRGVWIATFLGWISDAGAMAAMLAANFLDLRCVYGDASLLTPVRQAVMQAGPKNEAFLGSMVSNSLANRPPLGLFRRFTLIADGPHAATVDIKRGALIPITDIARIQALASGLAPIGTVARLRALAGTPQLSLEDARQLEDAFVYFGRLRLRHQAGQIRRGIAPDNYLAPQALAPFDRKNLKHALAVVAAQQKIIAQRYPNRPCP